jgi:hypothetical protein
LTFGKTIDRLSFINDVHHRCSIFAIIEAETIEIDGGIQIMPERSYGKQRNCIISVIQTDQFSPIKTDRIEDPSAIGERGQLSSWLESDARPWGGILDGDNALRRKSCLLCSRDEKPIPR